MKNIVIYSSKTGNTKKVAEAISGFYKCDIQPIEEVNVEGLAEYDNIILGCWNDKGTADKKSLDLFEKLENLSLGLFKTLGAEPDSEHAKKSLQSCVDLLEKNGNKVKATFMCQGKIDPKLTEMFKKMGENSPHKMDEQRMKRHMEAAKHPNQDDFDNAIKAFEGLF